jgi:undecaprenyl-phosphate galactose phosphotransferase
MLRIKKFACGMVLISIDLGSLLVSFLIAFYLRSVVLLPIIPRFHQQPPLPLMTHLRLGFFYAALVIILVFAYEKLYTRRLSFWEETKQLIKDVTISFIFITVLVFVSRQYIFFSRAVIVLAWIVSLFVFPLFRLAAKKGLYRVGLWKKKVLILGTDRHAQLAAQGIRQNSILGYKVVGFLREKDKSQDEILSGVPILGDLSKLEEISQELGVQDFIIALPKFPQNQLVKVIERCDAIADTIRIVPNIGSLFALGVSVENLGDVLSLNVPRNLFKPLNIFVKNIFEMALVVIISPLLLPLFLIIAAAIKMDSSGPVFFIQKRLGKSGKIFPIYKFRSMYTDGDKRLERYLEDNFEAREEWNKYQKIKGHDPRVTRVGKYIRKWSLDEIPQLINVLNGDMSLVGPRPYLPRENKDMGKSYAIISRVKPGMTGFWQVRGRSLLPFRERLLLDEYYIRNWSLWLDMIILFKTATAWIKGEGAF